jgi:hypothetical protein
MTFPPEKPSRSAIPDSLPRSYFLGSYEMKEIKQLVRDRIAPGRSLGHADRH